MDWQVIIVLAVAAPFLLFPAAFAWYLTGGGIYAALKGKKHSRLSKKEAR